VTTPESEAGAPDAGTGRAITLVAVCIGVCAALLALASIPFGGLRLAAAVTIGGVIGIANFLVLGRIGKTLVGTQGRAAFWGAMYFVKIAALFGGLWLLFQYRVVNVYGVLVGLSALVPGIVVGGVLAAQKQPTA
jgi:hypothetical protein